MWTFHNRLRFQNNIMKLLFIPITLAVLMATLVIGAQIETSARIERGWNILLGFGGPSQLRDNSISPDSIKAVFALDPVSKKYIRVYPNPENEKITALGDAYFENAAHWVYTYREASSATTRYSLEEPSPVNQRTLAHGWNLVPYTANMLKSDFFTWNSIKGSCAFEKIYYWNQVNQEWFGITPDFQISSADFDDVENLGNAVKVTSDCTLGFIEPKISPPPALPN